jgi:hypothetical protein
MKSITGFVVAAIVFALAGTVALTAARLQRHMADAQEQASTLQYAKAQESLDAAEAYLEYGRWLPFIGDRSLKEVRARKAALQYWQGDYEGVLPAQAEPVAAVDESNVELQLVVANAAFRNGVTRAQDRTAAVQALNEAANGYLTVLKNNTWHEDAAHNYEYVIRLRDEVAKGRRPPSPQEAQKGADLGEGGAPTPATTTKGFEIYVPLEGNERTPEGGEAGKASPNQRKG